jgi:hypothetical protein
MPSTIPQGRDGPASAGSGLCFHHSTEEIYSCKNLSSPLHYKRGARVHNWMTRTGPEHTHAYTTVTLFQSSYPHSFHHQAETWDLALSRNQLVPPTTSAFGCKVIQNLQPHWT